MICSTRLGCVIFFESKKVASASLAAAIVSDVFHNVLSKSKDTTRTSLRKLAVDSLFTTPPSSGLADTAAFLSDHNAQGEIC